MEQQYTPNNGMAFANPAKVYYADNNLRITDKAIIVGTSVYSISHLVSVSSGIIESNYVFRMFVGLLIGGFIGFAAGIVLSALLYIPILTLLAPIVGGVIGIVIAIVTVQSQFFVHFHFSSGQVVWVPCGDESVMRAVTTSAVQSMIENQ
jgi:hypothetical protein